MKNLKPKTKEKSKVTMAMAFKTIIWPRRNLVFIGLFLIVIKSLSGLILPWQSKVLLDDVVRNNFVQHTLYEVIRSHVGVKSCKRWNQR